MMHEVEFVNFYLSGRTSKGKDGVLTSHDLSVYHKRMMVAWNAYKKIQIQWFYLSAAIC